VIGFETYLSVQATRVHFAQCVPQATFTPISGAPSALCEGTSLSHLYCYSHLL
jgi:hypothetical protein